MMMNNKSKDTLIKVLSKFKPPEKITLSEFAERECYLPAEAGGLPGPYRTSVTPFHKEILDCITDKHYEKVTWVAGSQLGKSTLLIIASHYFITEEPSPIIILEPNKELTAALSDQRFRPYIRDNKKLKTLLQDKESKNNITEKQYPGGYLVFGSAQTITDVISRPIRILMMDEISSYPFNLKDKGNPISLAIARTASSFRDSRKIIEASTPGLEGICNITESYLSGDQRVYLVPCPHCKESFEFILDGLEWPKDSKGIGAFYQCPNCKEKILDSHKQWMLANGKWIITHPEITNHASFKLNGFYSPFITFEDIAIRYRAAKLKAGKIYNDKSDLIEFYNQTLALTWNDTALSNIGSHDLAARTEYYPTEVPKEIGVLHAGVDMQRDRAEITVLGFGKYNHVYLINHFIIWGDTALDPDLSNSVVYKQLDSLFNRPFKHQSGKDIYIRNIFIDAGDGVTTQHVRKYCLARVNRGIFAIRGSAIPTDPIFPGKKFKDSRTGKYVGYELGVNSAKTDIYHRLQITDYTLGGYIHFPNYPNIVSSDYFEQLTNETVITKQNHKGANQSFWKLKRDGLRNETWDCFVYALAAKHFFMSNVEPDIIDKLVDTFNTEPESPAQPLEVPTAPTNTLGAINKQAIEYKQPLNKQLISPRFKIPNRAF